jgi:hypothetical protein
MGGQHHAPAILPRKKTRYPIYRALGGLQGQSGQVRKSRPQPGLELRQVQPIASRYRRIILYKESEINFIRS